MSDGEEFLIRRRRRSGGVTPFTPAALFTGGFQGDWWSTSNLAKLKQDSAETTAVSADNDPVGSWRGNVNNTQLLQATAAAKPLYKSSNATVLLDGIDDSLMLGANAAWNPYPMSLVVIFDQTVNGAAGAGVLAYSASGGDYIGIRLYTPAGSGVADRGAANTSFGAQSYPGASGFAAAICTAASGAQTFRFNNGTVANGTAANTHTAGRIILGALRQGAGVVSLFSAGRVKDFIVVNKVLSAGEMTNILTYYGL